MEDIVERVQQRTVNQIVDVEILVDAVERNRQHTIRLAAASQAILWHALDFTRITFGYALARSLSVLSASVIVLFFCDERVQRGIRFAASASIYSWREQAIAFSR